MHIKVEGEVASCTYHTSGHLYFSIKDDTSTIKCVMWRSSVARMKFRIEKGMHIVIDGSISVYTPRGEYQFQATHIEPYGQGSLAIAFEQLKKKLQAKGYFESSRKKPLPKIPKKIALVTAKDSAALHDMLKIIDKRYPLLDVYVVDTLVQGEDAPASIARALHYADSLGVDIVVLSRGGGSIEDLWAFNEELVADAIFGMHTPVVSAIGHEVDTLISDFVADLRAPTPSGAIEMILPDKNELLYMLDEYIQRYQNAISQHISNRVKELEYISKSFYLNSPSNKLQRVLQESYKLEDEFTRVINYKIEQLSQQLLPLKERYNQQMDFVLNKLDNELRYLLQRYTQLNPKTNFKKGYAQIIKDGKISSLTEINLSEVFILEDIDTKMSVKVLDKKKI